LYDLPFCKNDGKSVSNILEEQKYVLPEKWKLIGKVEGNAMRDAIFDFFRESAEANDTLLFYFSGHGVTDGDGDYYFASSDIDHEIPDKSGYSFEYLKNMLTKTRARNAVIILDCCFSGAAELGRKGGPSEATRARGKIRNTFREGAGKCILASSLEGQSSYAMPDGEHSRFTYFLLEGMRGGDGQAVNYEGYVTPYTLSTYIFNAITGVSREQKPITKTAMSGDFPIAEWRRMARTDPRDILRYFAPNVKMLKEAKPNSIQERNSLLRLVLGMKITQSSYQSNDPFGSLFDSYESLDDLNLLINTEETFSEVNWQFDNKRLLITNKIRWNGIPLAYVPNNTIARLSDFWTRFWKQDGKIFGKCYEYGFDKFQEFMVSKKSVSNLGEIILVEYTDEANKKFSDALKVLDRDILIGKCYHGQPESGDLLYTYAIARTYSLELMTEEDHDHLFDTRPNLDLESTIAGTWAGQIINDEKRINWPQLFVHINRKTAEKPAQVSFDPMLYTDGFKVEDWRKGSDGDLELSLKEIKPVTSGNVPSILVGRISIDEKYMNENIPGFEYIRNQYTKSNRLKLKFILRKISDQPITY
jgi:hypothetical protein